MSNHPGIQDFEDPTFNPFLADELCFGDTLDPFQKVHELRSKGAVIEGEYRTLTGGPIDITLSHLQHFTVLGYDEVGHALTDAVTFSNKGYEHNLSLVFGKSITTLDAPEHTTYRKVFQRAFLPNIVAKWGETLVDPVVNSLLDAFVTRGSADLVQEFTLFYPFQIIYKQLGLPEKDVAIFHKLAVAQTLVGFDKAHGIEAGQKLGVYFNAMIEERRKNPGEDLVSLLVTAEVDGERLPEDVLISFLRQLINAGGDTTYRGTSVLLTGLLSNPEQLEAVRKDRGLIPQAIDEALRWEGPLTMLTRQATRDVELGGVKIPAGAIVDVCPGAANRDPKHFTEPDRFDIFRERTHRAFPFGFGPHICIGQHLARIEMTRALTAILDRLPNLRLDPDKPAPEIRGVIMRVPKHIFVRFG
ncbi:cytochrome P450 [Burkholderia sp. H160]|nr:cytochrome P450 [Burkholderia sp. H160]